MFRRYNWLLRALVPLIFAYFFFRSWNERGYRQHWRERLGWSRSRQLSALWVHAASVGEVQAGSILLRAVRARFPQVPIHLTVFTPGGRERALQLARESTWQGLEIDYLPLDLPSAVRRFLDRSHPRALVVMETEFWPNLLAACARRNIPVMYVSARLSEKSCAGLLRHIPQGLRERAIAAVRWLGVQTAADAANFQKLGAAIDHIEVTGNLKYDCHPADDLRQKGLALRQQWGASSRPVWMAASTHSGEEVRVLEAFTALRFRFPDLLLVLAPRHAARFDEVADLLHQRHIPSVRRSTDEPVTAATQCVLLDSLGELAWVYAAADVAFVGGSLVPVGGHNLLEPIAVSTAVVVGPHMHQQAEMTTRFLSEQAMTQLDHIDSLQNEVAALLADPEHRQQRSRAAIAVLQRSRGALARSLTQLEKLLGG